MANFVSLTALDGGSSVSVNPEEVASLTPVPASLLPAGVAAGTYVQSEDGSRVAVQGTVAATVTALAALGLAAQGIFDGATGATVAASSGVTCVRNGAGDYTITFPSIPTALPMVSVEDGATALIATINILTATTAQVLTFDAAGAANDAVRLNVQFFPVA